ncbi:MAG: alpha/beta hydrolase fold domain-containing protein [Jatrophihabitantaceae bacterium]
MVAASGDQPPIRVRCHEPALAERGVVVWAHGGSWVAGSIDAWHEPCSAMARACGMAVVSVNYRLAPRWHHPAPLEDVMQVLRWAAREFVTADGQPPLMVGGDSAGATIAASAALRCRSDGPVLAGQILAYPPLDPSCAQLSYFRQPERFPTRERMLAAWHSYRGPAPVDSAKPPLTPWAEADLSGLPPAIFGFGEDDPVADDSWRFAERLAQHGNQVSLRAFGRAGHGLFLQRRADGSFPLQEWIAGRLRVTHPVSHTSQSLTSNRGPDR